MQTLTSRVLAPSNTLSLAGRAWRPDCFSPSRFAAAAFAFRNLSGITALSPLIGRDHSRHRIPQHGWHARRLQARHCLEHAARSAGGDRYARSAAVVVASGRGRRWRAGNHRIHPGLHLSVHFVARSAKGERKGPDGNSGRRDAGTITGKSRRIRRAGADVLAEECRDVLLVSRAAPAAR